MRAKFIYGNILNELSENSTLYHRSYKKMEIGEVIKPKVDKKGEHWLSKSLFEKAMESYRQKNYPNTPQRFSCVYSSIIPRSRFKDKGYLYIIKAKGNMLMTNSRLIDKMGNDYDRKIFDFIEHRYSNDYSKGYKEVEKEPETLLWMLDSFTADRYWQGDIQNIQKTDKEGIEVLSDSAEVVEILGIKEDHLMNSDKVQITEDNKLRTETIFYFDEKELEKYKNKNPEIIKFIKSFKSLYNNPKESLQEYDNNMGGNLTLTGFIKKGIILVIIYAQSSMYSKKQTYEDDYDGRVNYKYIDITFSPEKKVIGNKPILKHKTRYFYAYTDKIRDISKYLKKI